MTWKAYDEQDLTAYALGEMNAGEEEAFEVWLDDHPEAREQIHEIRALAQAMTQGFDGDPALALTPRQKLVLSRKPASGRRMRLLIWSPAIAAALVLGIFVMAPRFGRQTDYARTPRSAEIDGFSETSRDLDGVYGYLPRNDETRSAVASAESKQDATGNQARSDAGKVSEERLPEGGETEDAEVRPQPGRQAEEMPLGAAAVKVDKDGNRRYLSLPEAVDSIEVVTYDQVPKYVRDAHEADMARRRLAEEPPIEGYDESMVVSKKVVPTDPSERAATLRVALSGEEDATARLALDSKNYDESAPRIPMADATPREPDPTWEEELEVEEFAVGLPASPPALTRDESGVVAAPADSDRLTVNEGDDRELRGAVAELQRRETAKPNTEAYNPIVDNPFYEARKSPLSTFSIDVDTASYSLVRRFLQAGQLPPKDAIRIEELINSFDYGYAEPEDEHPFAVHTAMASAPWHPDHRLAMIGLKGREISPSQRPPVQLVFLVDVSGSMSAANKLPLVKRSLNMLVDALDDRDRIALVVYAGASGVVLDATPGSEKQTIREAISRLQSGGSTHGSSGIRLAYEIAASHRRAGQVSRVILATDGDFNVGISSQAALIRLIEEKAKSGTFLTVLGFGMGNLKDANLEQLADHGNGFYAYIDSEAEAQKILVRRLTGTLVTLAKDVKIQVEFNPAEVQSYRLIGYANRRLEHYEFNDDAVDAGEIGAGHTVTALYEIVPQGVLAAHKSTDPLRYQTQPAPTPAAESGECFTVKLRYKQPDGDTSTLMMTRVMDDGLSLDQADVDFRFATAVAGFGMVLRDSEYREKFTLEDVQSLVRESLGEDPDGERQAFLDLVRRAMEIRGP